MPRKKPLIKKEEDWASSSCSPEYTMNSLLASIIKSLHGSIYWKDRKGRYLGSNDIMLSSAGMDSIVGKTDFDTSFALSSCSLKH